jgi:hypothetical protein
MTGLPYVAMPGWADLDGDGVNDFFVDTDGDGINDYSGMPHGQGFGWMDLDGDGVNDHFVDTDGDGVVDPGEMMGARGGMSYGYGYVGAHRDANGDGIDDATHTPYHQGFGWVDADGDGINDAFVDADGDGVNDLTGHGYMDGFGHMGDGPHAHDPIEWPTEPPAHGGGPMMGGGMM